MEIFEKKEFNQILREIIGTIFGAFIMAVGTSMFLLPNQLSTGGFAGVSTILYYLLKIPMGTTILILNIPLFFLAIYKLGKNFFIKSFIGTISFSVFIDFLDKLKPLTNDRFLGCIYGGILMGIGTGIILKNNSSTGGSDLLSFIARSYKENLRIGNIIIIVDIVVVFFNMIFFRQIEIALYSTIAIYIMGKIIDIIVEGIYLTKLIIIVSDKNEEISKKIGEKIKRGTTGIFGKGMYKGDSKIILMCAAQRGDIVRIKEIINKVDKNAFIIISNAREVFGKGFK